MFKIFLFLLVFTPLAFGTVEPWSYTVMEILTFLALSIFATRVARNKETILTVPGITPLLLFLVFILFQITPLPPALVKLLSPTAYDLHSTTDLVSRAGKWMTLSVHPAITLQEFFRWATYAAFYILGIQLLRRNSQFRKTVLTVAVFGALLSFSSILQFYLTEKVALWFRHVPHSGMILGPYINHNHYAGLMEMIFPVVLALFFFYRPRVRNLSFLKGVAEILSQKRANIHILIGTAALLIGTSIFVSLSRGGMVSMCISLIFLTVLVSKRKINRTHTILIAGIVLLTVVSVGWFGWDQIFERFERLKKADGTLYDARIDIWKNGLNTFKDFLAVGSGIGSFSDIYPAYKSILRDHFVNYAHNDYLQLAIEGGFVGITLAFCFVFTVIKKTYGAFRSRRDAYAVYIYMGSIAGIVALLIHSFVDFNLHVGANGLWFFFLLGLAVSSSTTSMRGSNQPSRLAPVHSPAVKTLSVVGILILTVAITGYNLSTLTANFYYSHIEDTPATSKMPETDLEHINKIAGHAVRLNPLSAAYVYARAEASLHLGNESTALNDFKKAIQLEPTNGHYLTRLGNIYAGRGETETADRLLSAAVRADIFNADYALRYGAWLLSNSKIQEGLSFIKRAVTIDPKKIDSALVTMAINRVKEEEIQKAIPDIPETIIAYAEFLYDLGKTEAAENQYRSALASIETQEKISRRQFLRIYSFFKKRGNTSEAMKTLTKAVELLPSDAGLRITLGDLYRDMGIAYRAEEEYRQALILSPGHKGVLSRLKALEKISP